ncbi:MAG TPA: PKD domain-containing protein [Flavipsychrobacter sp.]
MRKVYLFLTLMLTVGFFNANAIYVPITHTSGTVVVGNINVTVTPLRGPNTGTFCGTGPYQIGKNYSDGYRYDFGAPVTHVRLEMTRIHNDDTIRIAIKTGPGATPHTMYNLTAGNLTAFAGTCTMTSNNMITPGGELSTTGGATGPGQGIQVDISLTPALIHGFTVEHIRAASNNIASDVYYSAYLQDDSCSLGFQATVDSPVCSGRDVQLDATIFPNTTYAWTENAVGNPTFSPSANVRNPMITNINAAHGGQYFVTATRGTCVYRDTVNINVTTSPSFTGVQQAGPVCPGEDDTLSLINLSLPIGGTVYAYSSLGSQTFDPNQGYILEFPNMQPSQANIFYYVYAEDIQGCKTDTVAHLMLINEDVYASFTPDVKEGCERDTVKFNNTSTTDGVLFITSTWNFGDGSPSVTDTAPTHYYQVPTPNWFQRDYNVRLIADNGKCKDTLVVPLSINHPVKAEFQIDDDSICQGETITFTAEDSSYVKPGTTPMMLWKYGDGGTDTVFNTTHIYYNSGIYNPVFVLTDYLGCSDSFTLPIVVDSSGYVFFNTDKENVCVGEEIVFKGEYSVFGYVSATWDFGDGVTIPDDTVVYHSYAQPGTYDVTFDIIYRICPDTTYTGQYVVKPVPNVYLGEDTSICPNGEPVYIQDIYSASNPPSTTYQWHTPTKDVTPGIAVRHHGSYSVTANLDGCTASDTIVIDKNCYINIPNVFTPNGDGNGDYFLPRQLLSRSVSKFEMHIYNRWGEKVFETNALNGRGWDGKYGGDDQPIGVYIYLINVTFANGITERYQGNVTLLR